MRDLDELLSTHPNHMAIKAIMASADERDLRPIRMIDGRYPMVDHYELMRMRVNQLPTCRIDKNQKITNDQGAIEYLTSQE